MRMMTLLLLVVVLSALPAAQSVGPIGTSAGDQGVERIAGFKSIISSDKQWQDFWMYRLLVNLLGYATIILPGYLILRYLKRSNYIERAGDGCFARVLKLFVDGASTEKDDIEEQSTQLPKPERSEKAQALVLLFCFLGLQCSYLTWGVLQEKIMTKEYGGFKSETFRDSQFLVFVNRILAFVLAGAYILLTKQPRHTAPLYRYSYCSFSNIMSSWCQYEALKYVSFPTQVLAKASKIIPVMLMGKLVSKKSYHYFEYVTAVMISVGISLFLLSGHGEQSHRNTVTTSSGFLILVGYMLFDSFTSNWQGALFSAHKMSSVQMMCGVNLFSCLLTFVSLWQQGGFMQSLLFATRHFAFVFDICLLSVCSAAGQLFIYYTISQFGAVTFVIIMTTRQALAILLSCVIYGHMVTALGAIGIVVVFIAIFLRIYCNHKVRQRKIIESRKAVPAASEA
ncbi:PREDICTED: adenosine 3'-phospho 5'-phosphosulfate transporter 1-like [Priapulus caudatus]|uniref:Adenosine 3'-phospho 5'-phosphosulfate transporter 1 n=1 Tax=Priapulus caudatus TaxID=37621 RepID=A0ABM1EJJ3_PRICU|nr:PREDICTED: adenosine 3'-phospho 5'-phosphosulfate transporter 1-like [Priapulus caudatus]